VPQTRIIFQSMQLHDYQYDVFVSYRRNKLILPWVTNYFLGNFSLWLTEALTEFGEPQAPRIFFDQADNEPGVVWPVNLANALRTSKVLLSVCSPTYFNSKWCLSEWNSFEKREQLLRKTGLRIPVRHNDCEAYLQNIQWSDFSEFTTLASGWYQSAQADAFERKVRDIARIVAKAVVAAPPFDAQWPIADFPDLPPPTIQQQRI
jgi:TIR domain